MAIINLRFVFLQFIIDRSFNYSYWCVRLNLPVPEVREGMEKQKLVNI